MYYHSPKCPNCSGKIEILDMFDASHEQEYCTLSCVGKCLKCGHIIDWDCYYPFSHIDNICDTGE